MKIRNPEYYQKWRDKTLASKDPYTEGIINYSETWANLMEIEISNGKPISEIAEITSYKADSEGITGFMYGCAVSILADVWEYGEELRKWHNAKYNFMGNGTINPAVLVIND